MLERRIGSGFHADVYQCELPFGTEDFVIKEPTIRTRWFANGHFGYNYGKELFNSRVALHRARDLDIGVPYADFVLNGSTRLPIVIQQRLDGRHPVSTDSCFIDVLSYIAQENRRIYKELAVQYDFHHLASSLLKKGPQGTHILDGFMVPSGFDLPYLVDIQLLGIYSDDPGALKMIKSRLDDFQYTMIREAYGIEIR